MISIAFSRTAWIVLFLLAVVSWGGDYAVRMVHGTPRPAVSDVVKGCGWRGPWVGSVSADGTIQHPEGEPDHVFHPGDLITWENCADMLPRSTLSGEFTLWCNGRPIAAADFHLFGHETRRGWKPFGIRAPEGSYSGWCGVRRSGEIIGPDGQHTKVEAPTINLRIVAP